MNTARFEFSRSWNLAGLRMALAVNVLKLNEELKHGGRPAGRMGRPLLNSYLPIQECLLAGAGLKKRERGKGQRVKKRGSLRETWWGA